MNGNLFYIQLITSFFIGGIFIASLAFVAEKVKSKAAGIVIAFPSTACLSFFFLGWSLSADSVAEIIPSTFIPLGITVLFSASYTYVAEFLSQFIKTKKTQIFFSFIFSSLLWFFINLFFARFEIRSIIAGLLGYAMFVIFTHFAMHRKSYPKPPALSYSWEQKIGRAIFSGLVIVTVLLLGKIFSPFWGGIFAMFPAAMSSSLMILHWYYGPKSLFPGVQRFALGSLSILAYSISVMIFFPLIGFIWGTVAAFFISLAVSFLLSKIYIL